MVSGNNKAPPQKKTKNKKTNAATKIEEPKRYAKGEWKRRKTTGDHVIPLGATGGNGGQREATGREATEGSGRQRYGGEATGGNRGQLMRTDFGFRS